MKINVKGIAKKSAGIAIKSAGIGAGAYASVKMNKIGFLGKHKPAFRGAIKIAIGAILPALIAKGKKENFIANVGDGIIAGGAIELATAFDKNLATDLSTSVAGVGSVGDLSTMGEVVFDESYTSGVGATNDVMGATDETNGYSIEM
jgi:hypothetical protein